jgi:threonine dehydrogenase-like Zn-dependent dehydrogenase
VARGRARARTCDRVSGTTTLMAAAAVTASRRAELVRAPLPEPSEGQVLVRIEGCGVCASSLPVWEGRPWFSYPLEPGAPGHEGWGVVEARAPDVEGVETGARVALLSEHAFAQYDVAAADLCVLLPSQLERTAAPLEPVGCAVNVLRRADVRSGQRVAVVGIGFLGRIVAALAERAGADVVRVRRGATAKGPFQRVVECAGTQAALDTASALVAERGRLVIAGYHQDGLRNVDLQSWNWRGIDVVNAHERDPNTRAEGMRAAAALLAAAEIELAPLLTHRFPLVRLNEAFEAAHTRPPGFVKAWVEP